MSRGSPNYQVLGGWGGGEGCSQSTAIERCGCQPHCSFCEGATEDAVRRADSALLLIFVRQKDRRDFVSVTVLYIFLL